MEAYASLAKCYLKLNMNDEAQTNLEKYIDLAEKLHLNNAQVFSIFNYIIKFD